MIRKIFFPALLCFFVPLLMSGQIILNPRFLGGFVVTNTNDTLRGSIKLPKSAVKGDFSYTDILWRVRYIDKYGNETKFFPNQLKSFTFWSENGKSFTFLSRPNTVKAFGGLGTDRQHLFLELAINGHLKLLRGYFFTSTPNGVQSNVVNYLQKGDEKLFRYHYVLFRLDMAEYLKENSDLSNKIRKRNYHPREIGEIVNEYNNWYNKK